MFPICSQWFPMLPLVVCVVPQASHVFPNLFPINNAPRWCSHVPLLMCSSLGPTLDGVPGGFKFLGTNLDSFEPKLNPWNRNPLASSDPHLKGQGFNFWLSSNRIALFHWTLDPLLKVALSFLSNMICLMFFILFPKVLMSPPSHHIVFF
jgi:hypothetical protein